MGVVYKLKPEIKMFILQEKQANPILSCRGLAALIEEGFKVKMSKSTINMVIKEANLSMPVGRRRTKRRRLQQAQQKQIPQQLELEPKQEVVIQQLEYQVPKKEEILPTPLPVSAPASAKAPVPAQIEAENLGQVLLKAADYLLGGANYLAEEIKKNLGQERTDILAKTEGLIYPPLFGSPKDLSSYLNELQHVIELPSILLNIIADLFWDISGIKVVLSSGSAFYLDAQLYTVWSTPYIPGDLSSTIYNIRGYINRYLQGYDPFVLFTAPGYDMPTKEFFDFLLGLEGTEKSITSLALYGDKLKEVEVIALGHKRRRYFVFGLWPWQFIEFRKVKKIGEFRPFKFEALNLDLYLADAELELLQPNVNKGVTLRGCALKGNLNEKIRLLVLTNLSAQEFTAEQVLGLYLAHWPNLEETFRDYSRKVELFTYTANSRRFLSTEGLPFKKPDTPDIKAVFEYYLKLLDCYVRWHFLPAGYENKDFTTVNEHFYGLKVRLDKLKELDLAAIQTPAGYPFLKDLEYACRRINEREIMFLGGRRLFCRIG